MTQDSEPGMSSSTGDVAVSELAPPATRKRGKSKKEKSKSDVSAPSTKRSKTRKNTEEPARIDTSELPTILDTNSTALTATTAAPNINNDISNSKDDYSYYFDDDGDDDDDDHGHEPTPHKSILRAASKPIEVNGSGADAGGSKSVRFSLSQIAVIPPFGDAQPIQSSVPVARSHPSSSKACPKCGSDDIDYDTQRGDAVCVQCGTVIEENTIVAEVTFQEDSRGRSSVIGQHVRADGKPSSALSGLAGFAREATQLTIAKARRVLLHLVSAVRLTSHHTDAALRLFRLGVERNFHKGRRMNLVCCACLYVICRMEKTPHLLIDFSDILQINMYELGNTYLKFVRLMGFDIPIIDPSLYIHRFASKLEFGNKTHDVAMSALRLVARMKRDYMSHGRRPSGLCGAALIVAARMHNFFRTKKELEKVVRVGAGIISIRLQELQNTSSARLTVEEINQLGGDDGKDSNLLDKDTIPTDPPAFQRSQAAKAEKSTRESEASAASIPSESQASVTGDEKSINEEEDKGDDQCQDRIEDEDGIEKDLEDAIREGGQDAPLIQQQQARDISLIGIPDPSLKPLKQSTDVIAESLSDLDDDDINNCLLGVEETEAKKKLWFELNKDYLEREAEMERIRVEDPQQYKRLRPWRNRGRKKKDEQEDRPPPANAKEAASRILEKRSSKKINYTVLEDLFGQTPPAQGEGEGKTQAPV